MRLGYAIVSTSVPSRACSGRPTSCLTCAKVAVFLDGCFWHGCPEHLRPAKINEEFWNSKIAANRERDQETDRRLKAAGWTVIRIWEHEDPDTAAHRVAAAIRGPGPESGDGPTRQ